MNAKKPSTKEWVDPDDAPELDDDFFARADVYEGDKLVRRGRPKTGRAKEHVSMRLSPEVVAAFRGTGEGWQSRIDTALKVFLIEHPISDADTPFPIQLETA